MACFFSCRKTEFVVDDVYKTDKYITALFFRLPDDINPAVKRVADEMRRRNDSTEYVTAFAKDNGYPVWSKAILKIRENKSRGPASSLSASDTIVCIPFVQYDSVFVNGYVLSNLNSSLTINYTLAQDYKAYPFGTSSHGLPTAEDFTALIARLNHEVFGYSNFNVVNRKLFESVLDTATDAIKKLSLSDSGTHSSGLLISYTSCELLTISVCSSPVARMVYHNPCWSYTQENCWDTIFDDGTGGGGGTGGTGGGTGGGGTGTVPDPTIPTGGGSPVPHHFPCSTGSCTAPATGVPITPIPDDPPVNENPCRVMDSLMTTVNFPLYYKILRDSVTLNYEKGFLFKDPFSSTTYDDVNGTPGTLSIDMDPAQQIDGAVHNHYNDSLRLSVFSFEDFYKMYQWFKNGKIADNKTFTFGMVSDSTAYSMMITDPVAFTLFGDKYLADIDLQKIFKGIFL